MGIDAGTVRLGVGVVEVERGRPPRFVAAEVITAPARLSRTHRLIEIARDLREAFEEYRPAVLGVEQAFIGPRPAAGLALGEARGVVFAVATVPPGSIFSIESARWKHEIGLRGNAEKATVISRIRSVFDLAEYPDEDAADALGVALALASRADLVDVR